MDNFEQVFSDHYQMFLAGGRGVCLRSDVLGAEILYNEIQCIMGNGHKGCPADRMTDRHD